MTSSTVRLTGLLEDMPLERAIQFAHAAAAISVTRFGAQTSIPSRSENRFVFSRTLIGLVVSFQTINKWEVQVPVFRQNIAQRAAHSHKDFLWQQ